MDEKKLKKYVLVISVIAAALLVAVIVLAAVNININRELTSEMKIVRELQSEAEPAVETESAKETEAAQTESEQPGEIETTLDETLPATESTEEADAARENPAASEEETTRIWNVGNVADDNDPHDEALCIIQGWENTLAQLDTSVDVVFFGDSITYGMDFQKRFPDKKVVNLGLGGDTLEGMINRVGMIKALKPEKVFILAGFNTLRDGKLEYTMTEYAGLLNRIQEEAPDAKVYVQSILPISAKMQTKLPLSEETIVQMNEAIEVIAEERDFTYINIHQNFLDGDVIVEEYTADGVHPNEAGQEQWMNVIEPYVYE